jgi:hypothetical protein
MDLHHKPLQLSSLSRTDSTLLSLLSIGGRCGIRTHKGFYPLQFSRLLQYHSANLPWCFDIESNYDLLGFNQALVPMSYRNLVSGLRLALRLSCENWFLRPAGLLIPPSRHVVGCLGIEPSEL